MFFTHNNQEILRKAVIISNITAFKKRKVENKIRLNEKSYLLHGTRI